MIEQGFVAARAFGKAFLLLDRYFLSIPALERWKEGNATGDTKLHLVTKAKLNVVAYKNPPLKRNGRSRPPKKGPTVKLKELFETRMNAFQTVTVMLYGKQETVQYLCLDLLWGTRSISGTAFCVGSKG